MNFVQLGEVVTFDTAHVHPRDVATSTPYLGLEHIERGGRILPHPTVGQVELRSNKTLFTDEHVLYGKLRPNLAKVARPAMSGIASTDILALRPSTRLDRDYLAHFLSSPSIVRLATTRATGANLPRVSPKILSEFELPLPPIMEQRRIAAVLDQATSLRGRYLRNIDSLDALTRGVFCDRFDPGSSQNERLKPLRDLVHFRSGSFLPASAQDGGRHPVYGANGVIGFHSQYMFEDPVTVIGRVGACGAVHRTAPRAWVTDNALVVADFDERLAPIYLYHALKIADLGRHANRSSQPVISAKAIGETRIYVPSMRDQEEFTHVAERVARQSRRLQDGLARTDELVASLQSRAFRGEL